MNQSTSNADFLVAALYRFAGFSRFSELREPLAAFCEEKGIKGTLLLAHEGINGTVAGADAAIHALVDWLNAVPELSGIEVKYSRAELMPFYRMKVRLKKEIVTMGVEDIDPSKDVGTYVEARDWNALLADPDTVVIDTRNDYEVAIGTFKNALNPDTETFREFPDWAKARKEDFEGKKLAMFCTGGIRCEKATAFMHRLGLKEVYHLKGGILKYLEDVPQEESLWQGECFVFDERVSLKHGLETGEATLCRACRHPLMPEEKLSALFVEGISCPHCHDERSEEDRRRFAERQKQVELAEKAGKAHIGS
ncbi:rhodanese-related sulfurtransferase [Limoniibacter endophyticus]|uniref:tRNA uridine(34) hydroxylase n=1 Tax=Limoniibacter endophyticus TaxID=1565040 RepID=A0A8J3DKB2_9HYPH|nr:rhodanese-related sulfurtransferase [Limoniibacter endophyticus]GHC64359.1 UPF0176 protein [Limoniibacter endophyticus]